MIPILIFLAVWSVVIAAIYLLVGHHLGKRRG